MTIDTQKLRDLIRQACPLPWTLATSNSWRRIEARSSSAVCSPTTQPDGHPDLHFPNGGAEGPDATLLIEAYNALPALLDHIIDHAAELDGLRSQSEHWSAYTLVHRGTLLLCSGAMRDAYSDVTVERDRLHEALRWTAGALQAACHSSYRADEADLITINGETRTVSQILDAANTVLSDAAHD